MIDFVDVPFAFFLYPNYVFGRMIMAAVEFVVFVITLTLIVV